jgi:wyosine [tRNA(Phe)-imidazoG37] synthetase (radical SAM superfamily)
MQLRFRNINIELSSACNFDCTYCPEHKMTRKKGLMDYELAVSLLEQMKAMNLTEEINFYHMGESLLHKRAIDIFREAKRLGFRIKLNTNGSRLNEKMRHDLLSLDVDHIYISYHASYVKFNKFATFTTPISFEKWHDQIVSMVEDKYRLNSKSEVVVILFKSAKALRNVQADDVRVLDTEAEVSDAMEVWLNLGKRLAREYGLPYEYEEDTSSLVKRSIHALLDRSDKTFPVIPGFKLNLIKIHTWSNTHVCSKTAVEKPIKKAYFGGCDALSDSMAIFADGSYSLCCVDWDGKVVVGNAHTQPLADFLYSPNAEAIRKGFAHGKLPFDYCRECRGGYTTKDWAFNQAHSFVYYNSSFYRKARRLINMQ